MSAVLLRCSLGDLPVLSGGLVLPLRGNWTATVTCHRPDGAAAPAELSAASLLFVRESGAVDAFVGSVRRSKVVEGREVITTTIVGGAGKLAGDVGPRDHAPGNVEIPAGLVARGICDDAGERLADGIEAALDAASVRRWTRTSGPAGVALDLLADVLGQGWRVLPSGRVWFGAETWPTLDLDWRPSPDPDDGTETWGTDGAPILPGVTLSTGLRVIEAHYQLAKASARVTARGAVSGDPPRVPKLDLYRQTYAARVVAQAADGTLEIVPDDPRLGDEEHPLRGVPLRVGIPGCRVTVPVGARLALAFESADPRKPFAAPLDQDVTAAQPLALVGDGCGYLTGTTMAGPVTFSWSETPTGDPFEVQIKISGPGHKYVKGVSGS